MTVQLGIPPREQKHHTPSMRNQQPITLRLTAPADRALARARTQWQFGAWQPLAELDNATLHQYPQRGQLALLAAYACQQLGRPDQARRLVQQARVWGCTRREIVQILVAGTHNTLGRLAALEGRSEHAVYHFKQAVHGVPGDEALIVQARATREITRLGLHQDTFK